MHLCVQVSLKDLPVLLLKSYFLAGIQVTVVFRANLETLPYVGFLSAFQTIGCSRPQVHLEVIPPGDVSEKPPQAKPSPPDMPPHQLLLMTSPTDNYNLIPMIQLPRTGTTKLVSCPDPSTEKRKEGPIWWPRYGVLSDISCRMRRGRTA